VVLDLAKTSLNLAKKKLNRSQRLGVNEDEKKNLEAMTLHVDDLD
jgi:hypothetical protein